MFPAVMSDSTSVFVEGSTSSVTRVQDFGSLISPMLLNSEKPHNIKKKRNLPGHPDPDAKVIALSRESIMAKSRFFCEICNKGFSRDQNLLLHRRGHNLPGKLKQRNENELIKKKVYVCPIVTCVHHRPERALGDLTGIKKHFFRKHCEKKWKCDRCLKSYAIESDLKAHSKRCVTEGYKCECGIVFSGNDNLTSHIKFCHASAERSARLTGAATNPDFDTTILPTFHSKHQVLSSPHSLYPYPPTSWIPPPQQNPNLNHLVMPLSGNIPLLSATAHLSAAPDHISSTMDTSVISPWQKNYSFTQDFFWLTKEHNNGGGSGSGGNNCETELNDVVHGWSSTIYD